MGETSPIIILYLLFFGGLGALVKDILADGYLKLPEIKSGKLKLGFIGVVIVGASIGYLVDHSPATAFFAGYAGFSALPNLMPPQKGLEPTLK